MGKHKRKKRTERQQQKAEHEAGMERIRAILAKKGLK